MRTKALTRLLFSIAILTWLALVFTDLSILFSVTNGLKPEIATWLPRVILNGYIIVLFYYYKFKIEHDESLNFIDLLWRVFATGLVSTVLSLIFRLIETLLGGTKLTSNFLYLEFTYLINLGLMVSVLLCAFMAWKRLILYQKSKWLIRLWTFFELGMGITLLFNSLSYYFVQQYFQYVVGLFVLVGLILSGNMKWVAYLNFRQKWTGLLLLLLTIFYLFYIFFTAASLLPDMPNQANQIINHSFHVSILSLMIFVSLYSIFSFLVVLFNLPTTSVFEQKLEEVVNFQRISQSIQTEQSEESVYNILLETSVSTVFADAAWLELTEKKAGHRRLYTYEISDKEAREIIEHLSKQHVRGLLDQNQDKTRNLSKHLGALRGARFRSMLAYPIYVKGENIGTLALLKELPEGFNKEMNKIVSTFANQAGISIENFRLMEEALQNERYKEELKIAKTVQKSLLPQVLEKDACFDMVAFSESADEVGGDYYDTLRINEHQTALIIADVSGKGTTAAFHMSQMKGIFHSLAQGCGDPAEFMFRANQALVHCLERGSFISATFFVVDTKEKSVKYARAGHCPVLFYSSRNDKAEYFKDKGVALGMVRNKSYKEFIQQNEFSYEHNDVLVLYTDGITEAKNSKNEQFGNERLSEVLCEVKSLEPRQIQEHLINRLYEFSGTSNIDDDYTTMIIKFKDRT